MNLAKENACRHKDNLKHHLLTSLLKCKCVCVICLKSIAVKKINGNNGWPQHFILVGQKMGGTQNL